MPTLKRLLAHASALKQYVTLREIPTESSRSAAEPGSSRDLSVLSGANRIWMYTMRKSGTTFALNVLWNYVIEEGQRKGRLPDDIPLRMPNSNVLAPKLLRNFHSMHSKVGCDTLGAALRTQRRILLPTWGIEALVHTHRTIPDPHFRYIVGLQRNPFDFAVSSYHFHLKSRGRDAPFSEILEGRLKVFLHQEKTLRRLKREPNCIVLSYEALMRTPREEFHRLFSFLGQPCKDDILTLALERSSKEAVRRMEKDLGRVLIGNNRELQCSSFIRSGKIGEWRDVFSEKDESAATAYLQRHGVDLSQYTFD